MKKPFFALALVAGVASAQAQSMFISEMFWNQVGADQGGEFIELQGPANGSLAGHYVVIMDGDATSAGAVDKVIDLGTYSFGANGLLLIRDTADVLLPGPDFLTNVVIFDFNPDIENGTNTILFGFGTPPAVGDDIDVDNDGVVDNAAPFAGFTVADSFAAYDNSGVGTDWTYLSLFGGDDNNRAFSQDPRPFHYTTQAFYRYLNAAGTEVESTATIAAAGSFPGPYGVFLTDLDLRGGSVIPGPEELLLSPGVKNLYYNPTTITFGVDGSSALEGFPVIVRFEDEFLNFFVRKGIVTNGMVEISNPPNGTYNAFVQGRTTVRRSLGTITVTGGDQTLGTFVIPNGDVDADNEVGSSDLSAISAAFLSAVGDANYDQFSDIDLDGEVGSSDLSVVSQFFLEAGD